MGIRPQRSLGTEKIASVVMLSGRATRRTNVPSLGSTFLSFSHKAMQTCRRGRRDFKILFGLL